MDQFVFVSHATKDKPLVRPIVQSLLDAGLKVWLDDPAKLGYAADEVTKRFYRLRAGARWDEEIDEAKRKAACILVCWSKRAEGEAALSRHPVWFEEASYGRTEQKLVSCRINDMNPGLIPLGWGAQQMPDVRGDTERALIVEDVKRVMAAYAGQHAAGRGNGNARRSPRVPYLADRARQEAAIEDALSAIHCDGGVRPFFIVGPENECIDEFVLRLHDTSRRCLGGAFGWKSIEVAWPTEETGSRFGKVFAQRTAAKLENHGKSSPADLATALTAKRVPVAIVSKMLASDWKVDEPARVKSWLALWREVAKAHGHRAVVPVLRIKMPSATPGWVGVPGNGGWFDGVGSHNRRIWDDLGKLSKQFPDLEIGQPPILGPLAGSDIDSWTGEHFSLDDQDRMPALDVLAKLLRKREHKKHGVPHDDFAKAMMPFFRGTT